MVEFYKNRYYMGGFTEEEAARIVELVDNVDVIPALKNIIRGFDIKSTSSAIEKVESGLKPIIKGDEWGVSVPSLSLDDVLGVDGGYGVLSDSQTKGVAFMYLAKKCLLGDGVGVGKTVQLAGLVNLLRIEDADTTFCFLTEKTSVPEIQVKLSMFTGRYVYRLDSGGKADVEKFLKVRKLFNGKVDIVAPHSVLLSKEFQGSLLKKPFSLFVIDESSILGNKRSKSTGGTSETYKAASALINAHERYVSLDATPFGSSSDNIYHQLNILQRGYLPSKTEFDKQFCTFTRGVFSFKKKVGYKAAADEFLDLVKLRYFGRARQDAGGSYSDSMYKLVRVKQSAEQKKLSKSSSMHQMIADCPSWIDSSIEYNEDTTPKVGAVLSILRNNVPDGVKTIIYCRYIHAQKALQEVLRDKGYFVDIINGQETRTMAERTRVLEDLRNGVSDILITNVQRGLDMDFCDVVIIYTIEPNPFKMVQLEGRVTRGLDVSGKSLFLLVSEGKEMSNFKAVVSKRIEYGEIFSYARGGMVNEAVKSIKEDINKNV